MSHTDTLPPGQAKVVRAIYDLTRSEGRPPTVRAMCRLLDRTVNSINERVRYLRDKGFVTPRAMSTRPGTAKAGSLVLAGTHWQDNGHGLMLTIDCGTDEGKRLLRVLCAA